MKKRAYVWAALWLLGQVLVTNAQDGKGKGLEGLVAEWMKLMQERQQIEEKWRENKGILESTQEGLKAEIAELNDEISGVKERTSKWDHELEEQTKKREHYVDAKKWLVDQLPALETRALNLKKRFPVILLKENVKLASAFEGLAKRVENDNPPKEGMSNRLNRVVLILREANKFSQTLKVVQEKRQYKGKDVLLTVMYLGFSQAYAANEGQTVALQGKCGVNGWEFSDAGKHASDIWKAIQMAKGEEDVDFVPLPVSSK